MQLNTKFFNVLYILTLNFFFFISCQSPELGKILNEGKINYKVTYPDLDSNNVLIKFMPDEMEMLFKDNMYKHEWAAGLGLFKTGYVSDCNVQTMDYILKLINVKYTSQYTPETIDILNGNYPEYNVVKTNNTKEIAGYTCYEAIIEFPDGELEPFSVYYTTHITLKDPNWCNPLSKVPGVMFEYQLTKYNLTMKFEATGVFEEPVDLAGFTIPKEYEKISNKRMEYKIKETFLSFQQ